MERTAIQKRISVIIGNLIRDVNSITDLNHPGIKGTLVESFNKNILGSFLTSQFGIGYGVIVNHLDVQSDQTDIIIYDKRILPPFIIAGDLGAYPIESVVATIEVKMKLDKPKLLQAEKSAKKLQNRVFDRETILLDHAKRTGMCPPPLCAVLSFDISGLTVLDSFEEGKIWISNNIKHLRAICIAKKFSWLNIASKGWSICKDDKNTNEEIKRFVAVLLDNIRTIAENRYYVNLVGKHKDWYSAYIRK